MTDEMTILVEILGAQDADWAPLRAHHRGTLAQPNVCIAQRELRADGRPWRSNRRGAAAVTAGRQLDKLRGAGFLDFTSRAGSRFPIVKLTDAGDWHARALADQPGHVECLALMQVLVDRAIDPLDWLHERALATDETGKEQISVDELATVQTLAAPALARGWLLAQTNDHAYYRLTVEGMVALEQPGVTTTVEADEAATDAYWDSYRAERERLLSESPSDTKEIGRPYLPASYRWNAKPTWDHPGPPFN